MGQCCKRTEQSHKQQLSVKVAKNEESYGEMIFEFSTEKLCRLRCDCLLLFTDNTLKVNKNKYLVLQSPRIAEKVQEFFDYNLSEEGLPTGKSLIFEIDQPELNFSHICILCLGVWKGEGNLKEPLETALQGALKKIVEKNIQKLAVTQIDEEYGVPVHSAYKSLSRAIYSFKDKLSLITYLCDSAHDQTEFQNAITNFEQKESSQYTPVSSYY